MKFIEDIPLAFILLPFLLIIVLALPFLKRKYSRTTLLKFGTILFGAVLLILWLSLPITPVLQSFGYPSTVSDINTPEKALTLFQQYNKAIVRTTEVVYWMIFLTVFWLLTIVLEIIKLLHKIKNSKA